MCTKLYKGKSDMVSVLRSSCLAEEIEYSRVGLVLYIAVDEKESGAVPRFWNHRDLGSNPSSATFYQSDFGVFTSLNFISSKIGITIPTHLIVI